MSKYTGSQSLDAEIEMNFLDGTIKMDYSLNKYGDPADSNNSVILSGNSKKSDIYFFLMNVFVGFLIFFNILLDVVYLFFTKVLYKIDKEYQFFGQKLLKFKYYILNGIIEEIVIGRQETNKIIFSIRNNIFIDYEFDGDYKDKIKKVSLIRRFVKKIHPFGIVLHQQSGWNVIFEFISPPQHGHCILRHL